MLMGQKRGEAVALLSELRKIVVVREQAPPPPQQAPPQQPLAPQQIPAVGVPVAELPVPRPASAAAREASHFYTLGLHLSYQQNFEGALKAFERAIQIDPTALTFNARGYAQLRLHRYQDAVDDCSQAIRLNPSYANAYHNRSVAKRALGDRAGARQDARRVIEIENLARATVCKPRQ